MKNDAKTKEVIATLKSAVRSSVPSHIAQENSDALMLLAAHCYELGAKAGLGESTGAIDMAFVRAIERFCVENGAQSRLMDQLQAEVLMKLVRVMGAELQVSGKVLESMLA